MRVHLETQPHTEVQTVEGILVGKQAGFLVLRKPAAVTGENQAVALDGESLFVPRERVLFVQVLS